MATVEDGKFSWLRGCMKEWTSILKDPVETGDNKVKATEICS